MPDRTFVLLVDEPTAAARLGRSPDRIEREGAAFREAVQEGYHAVAERFPHRIVLLDGALPQEQIAGRIREELVAQRGGRVGARS
jgi:dTMP kinase